MYKKPKFAIEICPKSLFFLEDSWGHIIPKRILFNPYLVISTEDGLNEVSFTEYITKLVGSRVKLWVHSFGDGEKTSSIRVSIEVENDCVPSAYITAYTPSSLSSKKSCDNIKTIIFPSEFFWIEGIITKL